MPSGKRRRSGWNPRTIAKRCLKRRGSSSSKSEGPKPIDTCSSDRAEVAANGLFVGGGQDVIAPLAGVIGLGRVERELPVERPALLRQQRRDIAVVALVLPLRREQLAIAVEERGVPQVHRQK